MGIVALATLLLGLVGLFRPLILWALLIIAALLLRRSLRSWLRELVAVGRSALRIESVGAGLIVGYCAIMLLLALVIALAPPAHWDSLTYHLVAPQRYLNAGAITAQPDNFYLGLSQNVEMLFGLVIGAFGRDTAAAPRAFRDRRAGAAGDRRTGAALRRKVGGLVGGGAAAERLQPVGAVRLGIRRSGDHALRRAGADGADGVARQSDATLGWS